MSRKNYLVGLLALSTSTLAYGQDLLQRIPAQADLVAVVNSQAIVKHSSFEKLNEVLSKLGAFDALQSEHALDMNKIEDFDLAYDRNAYVYKTDTDSSYYVGILIPLKAGHQIEQHIFSDFSVESAVGGYRKTIAKDGKTQLAWNENSLFILTGDYKSHFFQNDSIAAAYGITPTASADSWYDAPYAVDTVVVSDDMYADDWAAVADSAYAVSAEAEDDWAMAEVDTTREVEMELEYDSVPPPPILISVPPPAVQSNAADWEVSNPQVDTAYSTDYDVEFDSYSEETYQAEMAVHAKNDSIRNTAFSNWISRDFESMLQAPNTVSLNKKIMQYDKNNTLVHLWVKDLDDVYRSALPYDALSMSFGFNMKNLNYGYQDATLDFVQEQNVLKLKTSIGLDEDVQQIFAKMYKNKANRKFAKYVPENHLGYLSLNVNTEAYLNSIPTLFERWYAPLLSSYSDLVSIGGLALQVALDEKAIAKVMKGDHVVFINDLKKVTTEYVDYEYDDDYNYTEVTKTKEEEIPNFLWMFTSEDQRIFTRLLAFAEKEQKASLTNGIFKISENEKSMPIYVFFKDDIVFVGNDEAQLLSIKENRFVASKDASVKKQIFGNNMAATVHTAKIPDVINKLGVPIVGNWHKTVNSLSEFGDISITANGLKKNRISGEFSVAFPRKENNALQYLLQQISENIDRK